MRGSDERTGELFSYVDIEERVPQNHPLRLIRRIVNEVLAALDGEFAKPARPAMPATRQASRNARRRRAVRLGQGDRRIGTAHAARRPLTISSSCRD